ncbi:MAG: GTPase Era [Lachnospiraceae bacterium]|jgi:GTP-binding protein Era|nr:GTPase Era [Lachnospiraceae bacterium]
MGKSGFVTIIGLPNVGKSTLMNTLIGQKLAITSYKPQTTRKQMRTVLTEERGQVVFLDTPGMCRADNRLGMYMERSAQQTLKEVDLILWLVEPGTKASAEERNILELVKKAGKPVILVINKADTVNREGMAASIAFRSGLYDFAEIVPVSAHTGSGMEELLNVVFSRLPEGDPFYDEDTVTDVSERDIAAEIIREKALRLLQDEVPHGIAVQVEEMKYRQGRSGEICDLTASIVTERESHKAIIIGKNGDMLRRIGTDARKDIENMLQTHVNLKLWVKVRRDWRDDSRQLRSFGYDMKDLK